MHLEIFSSFSSVQFSHLVCLTLCNPMDCSTPGLPVHHQLQEFAQTHAHGVSDAIQPPHPLLSPSPLAFNLSQHQSFPRRQFFTLDGQSMGISASTSVLPMNTQDWFPLELIGWISLQSKGSQESSPTPQSKSINSSVLSFLYIVQLSHPYMTTGKTISLTRQTFVGKVMSAF